MAKRTRQTLRRTDGLMADAARDIALAADWGWSDNKPSLVVPGSGGLDLAEIKRVISGKGSLPYEIPDGRPLVVNPRGFRPGSVHQDVFFKSIPLVLEKVPDAFFVCTAMRGQPQAEKWVRKLGVEDYVLLLPYLDQKELWRLFARADVYVSLSSHDGTPNTFLEALACGCFPVVGDITSLREWLADGENGLLVDPRDERAASEAVITGFTNEKLQRSAQKQNREVIAQRAKRQFIQEQVKRFYKENSAIN
jgi:glycosyltransferase involved in cell wall biosynthesis